MEEEEEAAVEKAEAVEEVAAVAAEVVAAEVVAAKVALEALEALVVRMFPPRMDTLGTLGLLSPPNSPSYHIHTSDLTITTAEVDLLAPTSVAHLVEEADQAHNTEAASSTAAARKLLTALVHEAP